MVDFLILLVIAAILGGAGWYVYSAKKKGVKCIGCPDAKTCAAKGGCAGCQSCTCHEK